VLAVGALVGGPAAAQPQQQPAVGVLTAAPPPPAALRSPPLEVQRISDGLAHPWGLAFVSAREALVTERAGRLRRLVRSDDGKTEPGRWQLSAPVDGVPAVAAVGQGGLLDVALDPQFASNRLVYLSYAEPRETGPGAGGRGASATAVLRARLADDGSRLVEPRVIFRQQPAMASAYHFGARLAFGRDGLLYVTLGERNERQRAQDLGTHYGKVVRIRSDGSVPPDNPFVAAGGRALPEIWSYGHRNPQSAAIHPQTGRLWTVEHGARGGDEVNIPEPGKNYGWPVISYGVEYGGGKIGEGTAKPGMEQPLYYWDPSIAPSGMAFYTAERVPQWKGNSLFVGALVQRHLNRLVLDGERVVAEERLLADQRKRIRDVRQAPDGSLWLLTDEDEAEVLRVVPR
jgi:glucose/arabinose dehydrogenase